ncbi:hypothetical protein BgiMline_020172 [Biomphalaria glabrata]|nr:hypothetical protein BgiMline_029868 [Biomphalaria glabrata]
MVHSCLQLNHNGKNKSGFAVLLQVFCATCFQVKSQTYISPKVDKIFSINRQEVDALLATGMGYAGFSRLMNMLVMYSKFYAHHAMEIHKAMTLYTKKILADISYNGRLEDTSLTIVLDVSLRIEQVFNRLPNVKILPCLQQEIRPTGQKIVWSSMFSRFVETFGVSDDNSNTIKAIYKSNLHVVLNVEKRECINCICKHLGTALRNVVDTAKTAEVNLPKPKLQPSKNTSARLYTHSLMFLKCARQSGLHFTIAPPQMSLGTIATALKDHCHGVFSDELKHWVFQLLPIKKWFPHISLH